MLIDTFKINEESVFVIAELSANHNQKLNLAIETIRAAKKAGADAIKLQTYTPDTLTIDCDNEYFRINSGTLWDGKTLFELYSEAFTPWEWHGELFRVAREEGLICFSTPFDKTAVDLLEALNVPAYKIASFEIQDIPLIEYVASKGKPIIISTGIADLSDIELAVATCRKEQNDQIILLQCTSSYPAPLELANLRTMVDMKTRFGVMVGLSDHTLGELVPVTAAVMGANVIEKHFILDKNIGGPDAEFSMTPAEFTRMVEQVRSARLAMGSVTYEIPEAIKSNRKFARSLFIVKDIKAGEKFTEKNVRSIRPGFGLHPKFMPMVLGRRANRDLERGTPLALPDIGD